jgi:hypothetical protein
MVKTRPRLLSALATGHVREGNVDEACRIGADALALADRQQVATNLQDVRRLRLDLEPWRDMQAVRELDERLVAVGGARQSSAPLPVAASVSERTRMLG